MVAVIASVVAVVALGLFCFGARRWFTKKKDTNVKVIEEEHVLQLPAKSPGRPGRMGEEPKEAQVATVAVPAKEAEM